MANLKVATFNVEWMWSVFGATKSAEWDGTIPDSFPGKAMGPIYLEPIPDVPALCDRIAGVINDIDAQVVGIQEGPPLKAQMELFVDQYLDGNYEVHSSNPNQQALHALVRKDIASKTSSWAYDGTEASPLRSPIPFYPWGTFGVDEQKKQKFDRVPLVLTFAPTSAKRMRIVVVHTKSKFSKLKKPEQWFNRDPEAVTDALLARQKLSAEIFRLREFLIADLTSEDQPPDASIVIGDFNDGAYAELIEREFLIHNIIDELVGSFLCPGTYFRHAMTPETIAQAWTASFPDPLNGGEIIEELIDHIVVSPSIWHNADPFELVADSCKVETAAYDAHDDTEMVRERGLRPSDHRPVSAVFQY